MWKEFKYPGNEWRCAALGEGGHPEFVLGTARVGDSCGGVGRTWCLHPFWVSSSAQLFQASACEILEFGKAGWVEYFVSLVFSSSFFREKLSVAFWDLVFCTCCVLLNELVSEGSCDWIILLLENVHLSRQKLSLGAVCSQEIRYLLKHSISVFTKLYSMA